MQALRSIRFTVLCVLVVLAFIAGCGGSTNTTSKTAAGTATPPGLPTGGTAAAAPSATSHAALSSAKTVTVTSISGPKGYAFSPSSVTIHVGDTVKWIDVTGVAHTATANDNTFNGFIPANGSWSYTFTAAGAFGYNCAFHPGQVGTVTVTS